jgi:hypothetical protein
MYSPFDTTCVGIGVANGRVSAGDVRASCSSLNQ